MSLLGGDVRLARRLRGVSTTVSRNHLLYVRKIQETRQESIVFFAPDSGRCILLFYAESCFYGCYIETRLTPNTWSAGFDGLLLLHSMSGLTVPHRIPYLCNCVDEARAVGAVLTIRLTLPS